MSSGNENFSYQQSAEHFATACTAQLSQRFPTREEFMVMQEEIAALRAWQTNHDCHKKNTLESIQGQYAKFSSDLETLKAEVSKLARSFQDFTTQTIDRMQETRDLKDKIEGDVKHFNTAIGEIHEKLGEQQVTLEDLQVDVAETVIDTSRLEDEQNGFDKRLEAVVLRQDVMKEESRLFEKTTKSQALGLEKGLEILEHMITIPDRVHSEDVHPEHDRGAYVLQLNDHVQQQNSQLGRQVYNPHGLARDSRVEDEAEVYDLRHRMNTPHGNFGDEVMDSEEEHHSSAVENGDQEMSEVEFTVWLDNNGDLQTDHPYKDDDDAWEELTAAWALQKEEFVNEAEENEVDWLSLDLHKHSSRCLRTALFPRTHRWTKANPGEYACRGCTNTQKICFGQLNGRFVALPLPNEAIRKDDPTIMQFYIAVRSRVTRSYHCGNLWQD